MDSTIPREINVITFNCWGLKYISKFRNERLLEIGKRIASAEPVPHIVGLQECWTHEDYQSIRKETKTILPYGKFYHSGIFGGGLAILSKWPIEQSNMMRYPLNGRPTAFFRGDWFVGKGVASARIRYGPGLKEIVEVFNTHLHAPYESEPNDSYICHRTAQAWEIAKLMKGAAERGHLVLGLGDFNMIPLSLAHRVISVHSSTEDIWMSLHPECSIGAAVDSAEIARGLPIPTAEFNILENGASCDSVYNTWRWDKEQQNRLGPNKPKIEVPADRTDPRAKRLDYIFASTGFNKLDPKAEGWAIKSAKLGMLSRHPTLQCSLSDHFSVECTLVHTTVTETETLRSDDELTFKDGIPTESPSTLGGHNSIPRSQPYHEKYLPIQIYDDILEMICVYRAREKRQRRLRMCHFLCAVVLSIGCLTAIWWSPRNFVSFLLMLLSTLGLSAGVIDGMIGGLFVGSEIRALKEFEWEVSNARAAASGQPHVMEEEGIKDW